MTSLWHVLCLKICLPYRLPRNLLFCTNVLRYPLEPTCCKLKAFTPADDRCCCWLKQERNWHWMNQQVPRPDCSCWCPWEVPTSATELWGMWGVPVAVYKHKQKLNVGPLDSLLLFFLSGILFPHCFIPSKLQKVWELDCNFFSFFFFFEWIGCNYHLQIFMVGKSV